MLTQEIIINENHAALVNSKKSSIKDKNIPIILKKRIPLRTWYKRMTNFINTDNIILPKNCRLTKKLYNGDTLYVIEEEPQVRTIRSSISIGEAVEDLKKTGALKEFGLNEKELLTTSLPHTLQLSFPYIVYIIVISKSIGFKGMYIFYRLSPISSYEDYLLLPNLPNISDRHLACVGYSRSKGIITPNDSITDILDQWWGNSFNNDYTYGLRRYKHVPQLQTFLHWAYYSAKDPMVVFQIPWLVFGDSLGNVIEHMSSMMGGKREDEHSYGTLFSPFSKEKESVHKNVNNDIIIRNSIDTIYLTDTLQISLGDEFKINGKQHCITCFLKKECDDIITMVEFEDENRHTVVKELTSDFKTSLKTLIEEGNKTSSLTTIEINGVKLDLGDLVQIHYPYTMTKKIDKITKFGDNKAEFLMDTETYILENIDFDKIDLSKLQLNGSSLTIGTKYNLYSDKSHNDDQIGDYRPNLRYVGVEFVNNDTYFKFEDDNNNRSLPISTSDLLWHIVEDESDIISPPVIRLMFTILINTDKKYYLNKDRSVILRNSSIQRNNDDVVEDIIEHVFITPNEIYIHGYGNDIQLKVGDMVVTSNWSRPEEMIIPKEITGFSVKEDKILSVDLIDSNFNVSSFILIEKNEINAGAIRKISFSCGELKAGDRIKSNLPGIANFPKSAYNTIIGFLEEGVPQPMVLCSNLCTVWYSDVITKFERWSTKERLAKISKYKDATLDVSKIKTNVGDIVVGSFDNFYMLVYNQHEKLRLHTLYIGYCNMLSNNKNIKKYGFLTPRVTKREEDTLSRISALPNCYGSFIKPSPRYLYTVVVKGADTNV